MNKTALVTGASSGIGRELATIHAASGGDVVLVARSTSELEDLKAELESAHKITATAISKDLSAPGAGQAVYDEVTQAGITVDYLINNAGFGGVGLFHEQDWEKNNSMIQLNIVALSELTRAFLPDMIENKSGRILNVSSTAGYLPGPMQAVYFATKAYVTSFSLAIAEELRDTNVTVTALLPGPTDTQFGSTSGMDKTSMFSNPHSPTEVAQAGYDAMLDGELSVIAGVSFGQKLFMKLIPFVPKGILLKQVKKMQQTQG